MGEAKRRKLKDKSYSLPKLIIFGPKDNGYDECRTHIKKLKIFPDDVFHGDIYFGCADKGKLRVYFLAEPLIIHLSNDQQINCRLIAAMPRGKKVKWFDPEKIQRKINEKIHKDFSDDGAHMIVPETSHTHRIYHVG
jgi:hypothetical protein